MKFSTNPIEQVKFIFTFYSTIDSKAEKTLQAPCLSKYIIFIPAVVLISSPPASKQTPLPTNATHLSL